MLHSNWEWSNQYGWYRPEMQAKEIEWHIDTIPLALDSVEFEAYRLLFLFSYRVGLKNGQWDLL